MGQKPISGWRWLGRVGLVVLALALIVSAAWGYWWHEMRRRCDAAIAEYRARGEPVVLGDLRVNDVPEEENALWYISTAGASMPLPAKQTPWPGRYTQDDIARQAKTFDSLRKARSCTRASMTPSKANAWGAALLPLTNVVELVRLAGDAAILAHARGDEGAALEHWQEAEVIPRAICQDPKHLIGGLVAVITDNMSTEVILHIAPTLRIGGDGGVAPQQLQSLLLQIQDDRSAGQACAMGFIANRTIFTQPYVTGIFPPGAWPLGPMRMHYMLQTWEDITLTVQACRGDTAPAAYSDQTLERCVAIGPIVPQFIYVGKDVQNAVLRRRIAATTVAIRLFHAETGRYPQGLQELVPEYLRQVPVDPRTAAHRPLGYALLAEGSRPVLWCAGSSNATDEVIQRGIPTTPAGPLPPSLPIDKVIYFDATGSTAPSSTQRAGDEGQKPDAPGKHGKPENQVQQ